MTINFDRVKAHIIKHQMAYSMAGLAVVIGASAYIGYRIGTGANREVLNNIKPKNMALVSYKSPQTIEVYVEALGDPGNIIQDLTTGTIYASQGQAAKALGVHPSRMTEHLKGMRNNIDGHEFVKLGKAVVAESKEIAK